MNSQKKKLLEDNYEKILNVGFCVIPYEDLSEIIAPNPMVFGTTKDEKVVSYEGVEALFKSQFEQMGDMLPSFNRDRIATRISNDGNSAFIAEEITLTITSPEEVNTIFMRVSCVMEYIDSQWKFTHWHASTPVDTENDHWHLEEWKREKEKLQKLVDEQTADLKSKNRELEIEAALERVRAVAMGMKKPEDMLDICQIISEQLQQFGATHIRNIQTAIIDEQKGIYLCYQYFTPYDKEAVERTEYLKSRVEHGMVRQMLASKDGHFTGILAGKELEEFREHRKTEKHFPDPLLDEAKEIGYCFLSIGQGGLGLTLYGPLDAATLTLFQRFHEVFSLAYQRFRDIELAQAQAREVQIELALERVRARTMAMQDSDELAEVSSLLFQQMEELGVSTYSSGFTIWGEDRNHLISWMCNADGSMNPPFHMPLVENTWHKEQYESWKKGEDFLVKELTGEEMKAHFRYLRSFPLLDEAFKTSIAAGHPMPSRQIHHVTHFSHGNLLFITLEPKPEAHELFKRFAKVFEQTYTRFLDLKKAEAQAREAQIEAALEKVRSRSLAMHKSEELIEVVSVLFEKLKDLQIPFTAVGIATKIEGSKDLNAFVCGDNADGLVITNYRLPYFDNQVPKDLNNALEKQLDFFAGHYSKKEKDAFYNYVIEHTPEFGRLPEDIKRMIFDSTSYTISMVAVKNAVFNVNDFEGKVLAEDEVHIIKRFARVFDQAYTRFLDLQKAEAQSREAQIELALERIRARTMAMQNSDELAEASSLLFQQMEELGVSTYSSGFTIWGEDRNHLISWMCNADGSMNPPFHMPMTDDSWHKEQYESWKNGKDLIVKDLTGEEMKAYFRYLRSFPLLDEAFKTSTAAGHPMPKRQIHHVANFSHGNLLFITLEPRPEAHELFKRFAKIFEQTYTRFLDLKKAEAQAREAEIQLALERVRARAMAMQKSDELSDVIALISEQMDTLQIPVDDGVALITFDEDSKDLNEWMANEGFETATNFHLPYFDHPVLSNLWEAKDQGKKELIQRYSAEESRSFLNHIFQHTDFSYTPEPVKEYCLAAETYATSIAFQNNTAIFINDYSGVSLSDSEMAILHRFAKEFDQTYIRFLDIKKAEAQAREAQIEAALERVRSRSMAMHKTEELADAIGLLQRELAQLEFALDNCIFWIIDKESNEATMWVAPVNNTNLPEPYQVPFTNLPYFRKVFQAWELRNPKWTYVLEAEDKKRTDEYLFNQTGFRNFPADVKKIFLQVKKTYVSISFYNYGGLHVSTEAPINESQREILSRFSKVFDQTYARFLDLQKAEAQAREAKIETALERVRSQAMAMHHTSELQQVIHTVHQELVSLEIGIHGGSFIAINEEIDQELICWGAGGTADTSDEVRIPYYDKPFYTNLLNRLKGEPGFFTEQFTQKEKKAFFTFLLDHEPWSELSKEEKKEVLTAPGGYTRSCCVGRHASILIINHFGEAFSDEENEILKRFTKVFEQTYTRFLDLQKAEAQAREAQIEASLERVRSRSMGMQKSEELADVAFVLFEQLRALGGNLWGTGFGLCEQDADQDSFWFANENGVFPPVSIPNTTDPAHKQLFEGWKAAKDFLAIEASGKELKNHYDYMMSLPEVRPFFQKILDEGLSFPEWQQWNAAYFKQGYLLIITLEPYPDPNILKRFAMVFDQTYTRFLDLKKAEAQAREAHIEAALEKVRSRTMAMQKGEELQEVAVLLYKELIALGVTNFVSCGYVEINENINKQYVWITSPGGDTMGLFYLPLTGDATFDERYAAWKRQQLIFHQSVEGEERNNHLEYAITTFNSKEAEEMVRSQFPDPTVFYCFNFSHGYLHIVSGSLLEKEEENLLARFTKVFEQSYTRFLDLQKAEEQAREAQIEAALERVRSRSMGMQKSDELIEVVREIGKGIHELGIQIHYSQIFTDYSHDPKTGINIWVDVEGLNYLEKFHIPYIDHLITQRFYNPLNKGLDFSDNQYLKSDKDSFFKLLFKHSDLKRIPEKRKELILEAPGWTRVTVILENSSLNFGRYSLDEFTNDEKEIFKRFGKVFGQAYTRFLDLQKAEKQAREAQIENALEKVRSRSLAMQHPDELIEVAQLLREEMGALGVEELETSSIYIHDDISGLTQCWFTIKDSDDPDKSVTDQMSIGLKDTWVGRQMDEFYRSNLDKTSILMKGDQRIEWIRYCEEKSDLFGNSEFYGETIPERTYHLYKFSNGFLGAASPGNISDESWDLMKRATSVFSFAYTRFNDLQKAEESARQSRQQASLDRVRADISSMRTAADLNRVTPLVWRELTTLGIPFIRCGVFIIHEEEQEVEVYLSKPDGTSLAVMHLSFDSNELVIQTVEAWRNKKVHTQHWSREEFLEWGRSMMEQNQVTDMETYQGAEAAPESLNLHFIPFNQGMLYVGSTNSLSDDEIDLSESLAKAFSIAYARYEDFVKLEKAKAGIEEALTELKATQSQLIQQEKLASLGQLTAGIAHEIKNPLNFVNNFSDLSVELIEETKEALSALSDQLSAEDQERVNEASEILHNIEVNLQKIHEHGSRADSIVKSMLQHSRGGDGKMEPTALNPLIKEYVNLAFHGMRASKEPINLDIDLKLDENVNEVPIIAEDFSRVILNLVNNAFDAMNEKLSSISSQQSGDGSAENYEPKLTVRTHRKDGTVSIEIEDNGPGIPDEMKDKIMQPFFTTKKGTAGTGLGLSITNDIIKAHGGELDIRSEINKGTIFTIKMKP